MNILIIVKIQPFDKKYMQPTQPSRRSSLSSHSALPPNPNSHKNAQVMKEPEQITKYIDFIRCTLKNHLKDKQLLFEQSQLKDMLKVMTIIKQYHINSQKDLHQTVGQLKNKLQKMSQTHLDDTNQLKSRCEIEIQEKEREWNQKMLAINNENGRKQQSYKEIIQKLMGALVAAQKHQQNLHNKLNSQMQNVAKTLQNVLNSNRQDSKISNSIRNIVEEIKLRQENSMISSKEADDLSLDQIDLPTSQIELDERDSALTDQEQGCLEVKIQTWLEKLICFGLFEQKNQKLLKKMMELTKQCQQPSQLLELKIYPAISDLLFNNMRANEERGWRYLRGLSGINIVEEGSRIQLRNINNLSDLDVNSVCQLSIGEGMKPN